jgi:hypothetical protein
LLLSHCGKRSNQIWDASKGVSEKKHAFVRVEVKWINLYRLFWKCVYATNHADFQSVMDQIRTIKPDAATYIHAIPHDHWATYAVKVPRFGHVTSNLAEIANAFLSDIRQRPILNMLHELYCHQMVKFCERREESNLWFARLVPNALERLQVELNNANQYKVRASSNVDGLVTLKTASQEYIVNLPTAETPIGTCTCGEYQRDLLPCRHTCAFAINRKVAPIDLVDKSYTVEEYRATYAKPFVPVSIVNLSATASIEDVSDSASIENLPALNPSILPPVTRRQRGRPPKERKEAQKRVSKRTCTTCGGTGHYHKTCRVPHS